ncbi:stationary-phase-induced ribosome-associated protein [Providencia manganoxydans]|uniref:stationary-phase-induced ribosome-associated protein n=1 Tax=Providencia manganoxydans TaxID=2923283 RepID=UPI0034DDC7AF
MVSNNAARRLLGMPYKLSRSKKNLRVSIVTKENATSNLPDDLQNKSVVAALKNTATEKKHIIQQQSFILNMLLAN